MPESRNGPLLKMGMQLEHPRIKADRKLVVELHQARFESLIKEGYGDLRSKRNDQPAKIKNDTWLRFARKELIRIANNLKET